MKRQTKTQEPEDNRNTVRLVVSDSVSLKLNVNYSFGTSYADQVATVKDIQDFLQAVDRKWNGDDVRVDINEGQLRAHKTTELWGDRKSATS